MSNLRRHEKQHQRPHPFACETCGTSFEYVCPVMLADRLVNAVLSWCYVQETQLIMHRTIHTGDSGFCCPIPGCRVKCARPESLLRHLRGVHNGRALTEGTRCGGADARSDLLSKPTTVPLCFFFPSPPPSPLL